MPKLWSQTIDAHRREVREAIVDTTVGLVEEHGLLSVTMSQIAEKTGIGRATLYKYFPDVESILRAWHQQQIKDHLEQVSRSRDRPGEPFQRLAAVLETYAQIARETQGHQDSELAALLHRDEHVIAAENELRDMVRALLADAARGGEVRADVDPSELATYCLHALSAARRLPSKAAVRRLVDVTLAGLRSSH